jgi:poly(3-hydroxybutyrate) depolymerase
MQHYRIIRFIGTFVLTIVISSSFVFANQRIISFGTYIDPVVQMEESRNLAKSLINPSSPQWQAKGDQRRTYHFSEANADEPFRVCVPQNWDGRSSLPLVMFLHGGGCNESTYLDQNNKQMVKLADQHGYILVSPMGDKGAFGNFLRLSAQFGNESGATELMAQVTTESERTNELSEKDVINVLELILHEYPIDSSSIFLMGHSMGSGGTWYIGGKYRKYFRALAPISGPFVQKTGYPWDSLYQLQFFVTEGIQTPSLDGSRAVRDWMNSRGFNLKYKEVNADHGGMVPLVLPDIFDFFDECRAAVMTNHTLGIKVQERLSVHYDSKHFLRIAVPNLSANSDIRVTINSISGRKVFDKRVNLTNGEASVAGMRLPAGTYAATITSSLHRYSSSFVIPE